MNVVLATSRWFGLAKRTADRLGLDTPIICSNGAEARYPDGRELLHLPLDAEAAREIVTWGDDHGWEMFTTVGTSTYMHMRPGIIPEKLPGGLKVAERHSDHLGDADPTCVQIWQEASVREVGERFAPKYDGRVRFSFNTPVGQPHYVVITHPDAEKAKALATVCEELGVAGRRDDRDGRLRVRPGDAALGRAGDRHAELAGRRAQGGAAHRALERRGRRGLGGRAFLL